MVYLESSLKVDLKGCVWDPLRCCKSSKFSLQYGMYWFCSRTTEIGTRTTPELIALFKCFYIKLPGNNKLIITWWRSKVLYSTVRNNIIKIYILFASSTLQEGIFTSNSLKNNWHQMSQSLFWNHGAFSPFAKNSNFGIWIFLPMAF